MFLKIAGASLVVIALLVGSGGQALAAAKRTPPDAGLADCLIWCLDHNRTDANVNKCKNQCFKYYTGSLGGNTGK
jgi:hypothetical protein